MTFFLLPAVTFISLTLVLISDPRLLKSEQFITFDNCGCSTVETVALYSDGDGKPNPNEQKIHSVENEVGKAASIDVDDKIENIQALIELQVNDRKIHIRSSA